MVINYLNFPFIQFCLLCEDETKITDYGIKKEDWEILKNQYIQENPSEETNALVEAYKKAIKAHLERNKIISIINYILEVSPKDWQPYFEVSGIKYTGDLKKDADYLQKIQEKEQTKEEIFTAQLDKLQKQIKESKEKKEIKSFDLKKIYKTIATLEKAGASIPDYEKLTCGKYEALTRVYSEKNGK
jgi:hypothetical protein